MMGIRAIIDLHAWLWRAHLQRVLIQSSADGREPVSAGSGSPGVYSSLIACKGVQQPQSDVQT